MSAPEIEVGPGFDDQSTAYGAQFHTVYDELFPHDGQAEVTAEFLLELAARPAPDVVELGVGSGRVALPLARRGARVTGVDTSRDLLGRARSAAARDGLDVALVCDDIRTWIPQRRADLVICVCATLAQLPTAADRAAALGTAAAAVAPGGAVVVETHSPERVRLLHRDARRIELDLPRAGSAEPVRAVSRLDDPGGPWRLEHRWDEGGRVRHAVEHAHLVEPEELAALAARAGLGVTAHYSDWLGSSPDALSPTYVCVLAPVA